MATDGIGGFRVEPPVGVDGCTILRVIYPDRDTPEVLAAYMKKFNVGPGWQFLTGKKEDIDLIRKKMGM